ncbi:hypothetical protein SDC9_100727 [bioreactor metagenome]|uniref:Uncharacterized protein n=1 Tax=bioreactor metagenome TaxID=1076179 RepID=A0A645AL51_9ZZZZ
MRAPRVFGQEGARDLQQAVRVLESQQHRCHLGPQVPGIILGIQQCLEALDALGGVEELLVRPDDLVDALTGQPKILSDKGGAVSREDPVGQL